MKENHERDRPAPGAPQDSARDAQPWHPADEPAARERGRAAPIGTHSLTGGGASVGMPQSPKASDGAERSSPREMPPGGEEPDPLAEPRASIGEILGRKP
ncbi:hypothetical protein RAMLITH_06395 [Ramlibacter sp. RBP-2]|uniref:Uncharacterized protein n=1 Tax=Ramlibacter lithotrophicus TaxID=2606681 RepID=A0A7X6DE26_9BURK|nr:hypothetical protein [Ramlibacter lithotrophicus]NKE65446.1 hypothetical protein [Ramlibacter lithotrophicus]